MITLIIFIVILSVLVLIHELGHFFVAKKMGVKIEEFGLGYPPKIYGKKFGETTYSLNALPFGGFVRLFGEEEESELKNSKINGLKSSRAFFAKSKLARSAILLAGVAMNFLLGVAVISYIFTQGVLVPTDKVKVQEVLKNSPAFSAGLKTNDQIISIDGIKVKTPQDLILTTRQKAGKTVVLLVNRCNLYSLSDPAKPGSRRENDKLPSISSGSIGCQSLTVSLIPRVKYPVSEGSMGVAISNLEMKKYTILEAPYYGTLEAFKLTKLITEGIGQVLWNVITTAKVPEGVAGPIGIYQVTGQAIKLGGLMGVLQLLGLLSLNLAVVNMLPIPALDGGKFYLVLLENIVGRKRIRRYEGVLQIVGTFMIFGLIIFVTISDLKHTNLLTLKYWEYVLTNFSFPH